MTSLQEFHASLVPEKNQATQSALSVEKAPSDRAAVVRTDTVVFYHGGCPDGFGAALCAWLVFGARAVYVPCTDHDALPDAYNVDVTGKDVFVLDFSFSIQAITILQSVAKSITLLDHHVSAQRKLAGYQLLCCGKLHFDLGRSGAMLAWEHFFPSEQAPPLIEFIQDTDLWRFKLNDSRAFMAWMHTQPQDFLVWLDALRLNASGVASAVEKGRTLQAHFMQICRTISHTARPVTVCGQVGLMVNTNHMFASEVGDILAQRCGTFALVWRLDNAFNASCSLRSVKGFDVEVLAKQFGGGGHAQACGFKLPAARIMALVAGDINP